MGENMPIIRKISLPIKEVGGKVVVAERVKEKPAVEVIRDREFALISKRDYLLEKKRKLEGRLGFIKDPELIDAVKTEISAIEKYLKWMDKRIENLKKLETSIAQKVVKLPEKIEPTVPIVM